MIADQLKPLQDHPLNRAAFQRLVKVGGDVNPNRLHLLNLGLAGLEHDHDPRGQVLVAYDLNPDLQRLAFRLLQQELPLEEVKSLPLDQLLESMTLILKKQPPRD